jgi:enamine deaminase RidA (YjgF/YER057c/UK114 family)
MRAPPGLHLHYVSLAEYESAQWGDVLGVATFNASGATEPPATGPAGIPVAHVSTPVLPAAGELYEVWRCGEPAESGEHERVRFRRSGEMLFGCIAIPEADSARSPSDDNRCSPLQEATAQAYRQIFATLVAENYPHLLRVWNYLPAINRAEHGGERYRQFNRARAQALRACGRAHQRSVPAASALGSPLASPLVVYFLAGRTAPTFVENPRQVSAYHYPREYGSHPPAFSRATLLRHGSGLALFISGTASIVGHRSLHLGDTAAQTRETLANIEALLVQANRAARGARFELSELACKVYVRRPADLPLVQAELDGALGGDARVIYLQADICRQDLLVEIEAAAMYPRAA